MISIAFKEYNSILGIHNFLKDNNCLVFYAPIGCLVFLVLSVILHPNSESCMNLPEMGECFGNLQVPPTSPWSPVPSCSHMDHPLPGTAAQMSL